MKRLFRIAGAPSRRVCGAVLHDIAQQCVTCKSCERSCGRHQQARVKRCSGMALRQEIQADSPAYCLGITFQSLIPIKLLCKEAHHYHRHHHHHHPSGISFNDNRRSKMGLNQSCKCSALLQNGCESKRDHPSSNHHARAHQMHQTARYPTMHLISASDCSSNGGKSVAQRTDPQVQKFILLNGH